MSKDKKREDKEETKDKKASGSEEKESAQSKEASGPEPDVEPVRVEGRKIGEKSGNLGQRGKWFQQRRG